VLGAEDYARGKPAPDSFALAISRLQVTPGRCVAVEDATPGILSARAAGAQVIAVRAGNFAGYDLSPADVVVDTLDDVTDELVDSLIG
jgi:beta-phosphoglucomutase-like phosphatase (HAD superfamily)